MHQEWPRCSTPTYRSPRRSLGAAAGPPVEDFQQQRQPCAQLLTSEIQPCMTFGTKAWGACGRTAENRGWASQDGRFSPGNRPSGGVPRDDRMSVDILTKHGIVLPVGEAAAEDRRRTTAPEAPQPCVEGLRLSGAMVWQEGKPTSRSATGVSSTTQGRVARSAIQCEHPILTMSSGLEVKGNAATSMGALLWRPCA